MTQQERSKMFASLHHRMEVELEAYKKKLLTLPPEQIAENSYRYAMYGELMNAIDSFGADDAGDEKEMLRDEQLNALARLEFPLDSAFWSLLDSDYDTVDSLRYCIRELADQELQDPE